MYSQYLSLLALCGTLSNAFSDTVPLFAFISSNKPTTHISSTPEQSIVQSSDAQAFLSAALAQCPTDAYVFVSQPGVSSRDFGDKNAAPHLRRLLTSANETSHWRLLLPEVIGEVDLAALHDLVVEKCGATTMNVDHASGIIKSSDSFPLALTVGFPMLPRCPKARPSEVFSHDSFLNTVLSNLNPRTYTVIYTSATLSPALPAVPGQPTTHKQFDFDAENTGQFALHLDLKRDVRPRANRSSETPAGGALFETYAFFSPGLFMAAVVGLLLFLILYVGITAISSLEIPVYAFSKEMGPAAQRNKQQ